MVVDKVLLITIVSCLHFGFAQQISSILPAQISSAVVEGTGDGVCPSPSSINSKLNVTKKQMQQAVTDSVSLILDQRYTSPGSCQGTGWTRVAFLNMSDPDEVCPLSLRLITSPVRGCGGHLLTTTCDSTVFTVSVQSYSAVCGRVLAYQRGSVDVFENYVSYGQTSIESAYMDGVSLTYGPAGSRQHNYLDICCSSIRTKFKLSHTTHLSLYQCPVHLVASATCINR